LSANLGTLYSGAGHSRGGGNRLLWNTSIFWIHSCKSKIKDNYQYSFLCYHLQSRSHCNVPSILIYLQLHGLPTPIEDARWSA
jgi:hypothetical protein